MSRSAKSEDSNVKLFDCIAYIKFPINKLITIFLTTQNSTVQQITSLAVELPSTACMYLVSRCKLTSSV